MARIKSPRMSLKGWSFGQWLKGNWKTIKELLKVGLPLVASMNLFDPVWAEFISTILGKFLLDTGEYFFKKY